MSETLALFIRRFLITFSYWLQRDTLIHILNKLLSTKKKKKKERKLQNMRQDP